MEYYAHKRGEDRESVIDHLKKAAEKAESYGDKFGCGELAKRNALIHDAGKLSKRFQDVLFHGYTLVNHALSGAQILYELTNHSTKMADRISYESIYSHHSDYGEGINFIGNSLSLRKLRLPKDFFETDKNDKVNAFSSASEFEDALNYVKDNALYFPVEGNMPEELDKEELMLFARMIHSCLVDADYSSTSEYMNPEEQIDEFLMDAEKMLEAVNIRKQQFASSGVHNPMQALRDYVYNQCCKGAELKPGLYTLTAPTGLGKTMASMAFAVRHAMTNKLSRIFVVLPYLSITLQSYEFYKNMFANLGIDNYIIEDDSNVFQDSQDINEEAVKINYLRYTDRWNAPVIITTSVKFFETLMSCNTPSLRKLHQISNSVIIFDESQTLKEDVLDVTINTLKSLPRYFNTTVLLSTATQPLYSYRKNIRVQFEELIDDPVNLYRNYTIAKNTKAVYEPDLKSYDEITVIASEHYSALIVVNTTRKATRLYEAVVRLVGEENCLLLTSWFSGVHKRDIIDEVNTRIKKGEKCILISTQCIEAGVDLDFPFGMREIGPWTSLVQTAGRINRHGMYSGEFIIFELNDDGYPDNTYRNLTSISRKLLLENSEANLNDLDTIRRYYKEFFECIKEEDTRKIREPLENLDIYLMGKNYRLIDNMTQATVLVPYGWGGYGERDSFDEFAERLRSQGYKISKKEMNRYRKYSVNITLNKDVQTVLNKTCKRLSTYGDLSISLNWYIDEYKLAYDKKTGFKRDLEEVNADDTGAIFA